MFKLIIIAIVTTVATLVVFTAIDPNRSGGNVEMGDTTDSNANNQTAGGYSYSIEGDVNSAGTYNFSTSSITMADLIEAAGGLTNSADERCYFEDASLTSGKTYFISSLYDSSNVCSLVEVTKVNINTDDAATMISGAGFTTSVANSIVSYRVEHGEFKTIEDLLDVYGIGNATYRRARNLVILHE